MDGRAINGLAAAQHQSVNQKDKECPDDRGKKARGFALAPRLTVYPEFAADPDRGLDPGLVFPVGDRADAALPLG